MMDLEDKAEDKTVSISLWSDIKRYDTMRKLIPQNTLVNEEDMVPGLAAQYGDVFPKYDPKPQNPKEANAPVEMRDSQPLFISNL